MSWTNNLENASLKSLSLEASSDNSFDYNEMLSILQTAAIGGISASEYTDLQSIYTNAVDSFSSNYVKTISYNTIYTNPANEKWWGGAQRVSSAQELGNMHAEMSEQKANWLVDKWFLGLDTPINGRGYTYDTPTGALFVDGIGSTDISQGRAGSCYLLASMAGIAEHSAPLIEDLFIDNGNGTYGVKFYINDEMVYTTVNKELSVFEVSYTSHKIAYASNPNHTLSGEIWVSLLEKAYVQLNSQEYLQRIWPWQEGVNQYHAINGGWASPLKHLTGQDYTYYSSLFRSSADSYNRDVNYSGNPETYKYEIIGALKNGAVGWLATFKTTVNESGKNEFIDNHAFAITDYDDDTELFTLSNPWGNGNDSYEGEFQVYFEDFWNNSIGGLLALTDPIGTPPEPIPDSNYTILSDSMISETAVTEGNLITFTISRDHSDSAATVYLRTVEGSASRYDFNGFDRYTVQFAPNETTKTISVETFTDHYNETVENFELQLFANSTDLTPKASAVAHINDTPAPDYSYTITSNATNAASAVYEGSPVTFTITRHGTGSESSVYFERHDGTASWFYDYTGSGIPFNYKIHFSANATTRVIHSGTPSDDEIEGVEYYTAVVYKNIGDEIPEDATLVYIRDKELPYYSYSIQSSASAPDFAAKEGENVTFTITRSGSGTEATIFVATEDITANSGSDYEQLELQALTFAKGQKTITLEVETLHDSWYEIEEYFKLNLFRNATDSTPTSYATAFITENPMALYNYTIDNSAIVYEGGTVTFTITRDGSGETSTVYLSTEDGSANSSDYDYLEQFALNFAAFETSKTVTLNVYEDFADEADENFWLNLYYNKSDSGYVAQGEVTIENVTPQTDFNYTIISDSTLAAPGEEGGKATFTITRDDTGSASTVYLSTNSGSADSSDYRALNQYALDFASYETIKTIEVDLYQDTESETLEYFWLDLYKSYSQTEYARYDAYGKAYIQNVESSAEEMLYNYSISTDAGYNSPVTEGDSITLTITRDDSGSQSTVYIKTYEGTAQVSDFAGIDSQAITFAEYETLKTITIDTYQDSDSEYPEHFWAGIYRGNPDSSNTGNALASTQSYIQDGDNVQYGYTISSNNRKVTEGDSITYTITRDDSGTESKVYLNTLDSVALAGSDFAGFDLLELEFADYETSKTITIDTYQDNDDELAEGFWLQLFTAYSDRVDNNYAAYDWGLIEDARAEDIPDYSYTLASDSTESDPALEGDSLTFTINRSSSGSASTIYLQTSDSSATGGPDYKALTSHEINFAEYEVTKTITLDSYQDSDIEGVESFGLELYISQADLQSSNLHAWTQAYIDDQPIKQYNYTLTSDNSPVTEGEALNFTITRDGSGSAATVYLSTKSGTAIEGGDFEELDRYSVDFADYETSKTITLDTYQDSNDEGEEYLFLDLYTSVSDALEGDYAAYTTARIEDPESTPDPEPDPDPTPDPEPDPVPEFNYTITPSVDTVDEGDAFTFTITRSATGAATTVYLKTNDSTTNGSLDYDTIPLQTVDFADYETSKTVTIDTYQDSEQENTESFGLELYETASDLLSSNIHAWATANITDTTEEQVEYNYTVEADNSPATEGETLSFTITRNDSGTESSVFMSSTDGTANAGSDFAGVSAEELTFAANETTKTFTLDTFEDIQTEGSEVFWLDLFKNYADAQSGVIHSYALATIADNVVITDFNYAISSDTNIDNPTGEGGSISFTITRDGNGSESTVYLSTSDSTTLANLDYAALSGYALTFGAGETSKTISIDTYQDNLSEGVESFSLELYKSQAELQDRDYHAWYTAAIEDTETADFSYTLTSLNSPVQEGEELIFEITRNGSGSESTVYINTSDDTATEGDDYTGLSLQAVEFGVNETSKTITISTTADAESEGDEFFWVDLFKTQSDAQNGTFEAYSWGMIQDNTETNSALPEAAQTQSNIITRVFAEQAPETFAEQENAVIPSYPGHSQGMFNNNFAFAAIKTDGSVVSWGNTNSGGNSSTVTDNLTDVQQIASNSEAFAALKSDGSVVTWGNSNLGGDSSAVNSDLDGTISVTAIFSTEAAFAALREDGSVITWGATGAGADSSATANNLNGDTDVTSISSNMSAFAAIRSDGSVVTWGFDTFGGDNSSVADELDGSTSVTQVFSTGSAFAALRSDGSVVTWGSSNDGGDSSNAASQIDGSNAVSAIYATTSAFAALRSDGSVVTWGDLNNGGSSDAVASQLTDVTSLHSTNTAFAALLSDGSVVTWGDSPNGGDSSSVANDLDGSKNVVQLYANESAFAALLSDGSVVTWGNSVAGGDSSSVSSSLNGDTDVVDIVTSNNAFAAILADGSVVSWGDTLGGGDSSAVSELLDGSTSVTNVYSSGFAFAALKEDGTVVTWGDFEYGGNSTSVSDELTNIVGMSSTGTNELPDITAPDTITYTDTAADDNFTVTNGTIEASDSNDLVFKFSDGSQSQTGTFGTITLEANTGAWSYTPDDAAIEGLKESASENFTVVISDGQSSSSTTITVELLGSNDTTDFSGDTSGAADEDNSTTSGTLTVDDRDNEDTVSITASTESSDYGTFTIDTEGQWNYVLNAEANTVQDLDEGQTVEDSFTVTGSDNSTQTITITISGQEDGEGPSGGEHSITANEGGNIINGNLTSDSGITFSAADDQSDIAGFLFNNDGSYSFDPDNESYHYLTEGEVLELSFNYQASDASLGFVNITLTGTNDQPTANISLKNLSIMAGVPFSYTLDANTFIDAEDDDLIISVSAENEETLPDWLNFDTSDLTISGIASGVDLENQLTLQVSATDDNGAVVSEDITVNISNGDAQINSTASDDIAYGSDAEDTLLVSYLPSQYTFADGVLSSVEGEDSLIKIDTIGFGYGLGHDAYKVDVALDDLIDPEGDDVSYAQELLNNISDLYIAYFGRAPDAKGFTYWFQEIYTGSHSFAQAATAFSFSNEYRETYPTGSSNRDFVESVYQNLFNREPDTGGWNYWEGRLDGGLNRDVFLLSVINGAYAPTSGDEDRNLLSNKHDVAVYYAEQSSVNSDEGFDSAINELLNLITDNADTAESAVDVIDHAFSNDITLSGIMEDQSLLDQIWG